MRHFILTNFLPVSVTAALPAAAEGWPSPSGDFHGWITRSNGPPVVRTPPEPLGNLPATLLCHYRIGYSPILK